MDPVVKPETTFHKDLHKKYLLSLEAEKFDRFEYWVTEHLRLSGIYWGFVAMSMISPQNEMNTEKAIEFALACLRDDGGFGGNRTHDSHLLYTTSGIQVLAMCNALDRIDVDKVASWIKGLQREDGSFVGDKWGEVDTRFSFCAVASLALLKRLHVIDTKKAVAYVLKCKNFDGAFGVLPGAESHAGQTFCCIGLLSILNALHYIDVDLLGWWLAERQVRSSNLTDGGLNGRPEKIPDVCYSWWVLSSLAAIDRLQWIDKKALIQFILNCQDAEDGGISDKPGNVRDVYHTCFGCAGLSLLGYEGMLPVDYRFCMPKSVINKLDLPEQPKMEL